MTTRDLDVVLFGATGFVGELTAAHLAQAAPAEARIALAGRSADRLRHVRDRLPPTARHWEHVAVDAYDAEGLRSLAERTTVLASTVGPYARYGRDAVTAAAETGTHYVDLTGEVLFVRWSMDHVSTIAQRTGARIVHSCGFDSVPSDLGVLVTARQAAADGEGTLTDTTLVVRDLKGGLSGGTIDSLRQQMIMVEEDPTLRAVLGDRYAFSPRRDEEPGSRSPRSSSTTGRLRRLLRAERDPQTDHWTGPFMMAGYNTRLVRLSNTLTDWSYGRDFRYRELSDMGAGPLGPLRAAGMGLALGGVAAGLSRRTTRAVLDRVLPKPGQGPTEERRAAGRFRMEITATTTSGARYRTTIADDRDPGYDSTAVMLGQSALCLALDRDRLPDRTGVLTPATGMGEALVDRLRARGMTLEVQRIG